MPSVTRMHAVVMMAVRAPPQPPPRCSLQSTLALGEVALREWEVALYGSELGVSECTW